jgi:hypothetical protein
MSANNEATSVEDGPFNKLIDKMFEVQFISEPTRIRYAPRHTVLSPAVWLKKL